MPWPLRKLGQDCLSQEFQAGLALSEGTERGSKKERGKKGRRREGRQTRRERGREKGNSVGCRDDYRLLSWRLLHKQQSDS